MKVKVANMQSSNGKEVPNQFIISISENNNLMVCNPTQYFQSYKSVIAKIDKFRPNVKTRQIWLDINKWDYSRTTGKYRNQFLGETKKETEAKIKSGVYILTDLN